MLNENEVAVCISGLARDGYETAIKNVHKVFPYDTFYLHWEGYDKPDVPNCILVKEPIIDYHCSFDTQYKPDCKIWKYIHRLPDPPNDKGGKIWWKPNYDNVIKQGFKQLLGHYYLINSLPEKYKTFILSGEIKKDNTMVLFHDYSSQYFQFNSCKNLKIHIIRNAIFDMMLTTSSHG
jgi:hypothetical protein